MTDSLRRIGGLKAHAWKSSDDLGVAFYDVKRAKIITEQAKAHLEQLILDHFERGMPVSVIAKRAHTSRSVIYRVLHKHNVLTNTQEDVANGTEPQDEPEQDEIDRGMASGY